MSQAGETGRPEEREVTEYCVKPHPETIRKALRGAISRCIGPINKHIERSEQQDGLPLGAALAIVDKLGKYALGERLPIEKEHILDAVAKVMRKHIQDDGQYMQAIEDLADMLEDL